MLLSIVLPSIRVEKLDAIYESIKKACSWSFELIVCGPYEPSKELLSNNNVKFIKDFGSPTRASQIAACEAKGEFITWIADDAVLIENSIDIALDKISQGEKSVVVAKYYEGQNGTQKVLQFDAYFRISSTPCATPYFPSRWWLFNVAIMRTKYFKELGGWDTSYQGTWVAHTDLAVRAQEDGAQVVMSDVPILDCDWTPGPAGNGDHMPIYECQTFDDVPMFLSRYGNRDWRQNNKLCIDMNNWKNTEEKWKKRFK